MLLGPQLKHQQGDVGLGRAEHKILQKLLRTGTFLLSKYIFEWVRFSLAYLSERQFPHTFIWYLL